MLKALIFDCDGVIADSEHLHFSLFQKILAGVGIPLTQADYIEKYLAMDDKGHFQLRPGPHSPDGGCGKALLWLSFVA